MNKIYVDKARLLRRVIVISWITLALCFVVKIFGGNFFEIMCGNPNYKALCEYADSHFWCKYLLGASSTMLCQSLYNLSIIQKYKFDLKGFLLTFISVLASSAIRYFYNGYLTLLLDLWLFAILPMILMGKNYKKYWHILVAWALTFIFQLVSLLIKNLAIKEVDDSTFVSLIYMIDLYLMCFLYYLYRNYKKEKKNMGMFWGMFAGKPVDKLKEMKAKREKQIAKLNEEVKAIETEIAKQSENK
jgi:hypothetical protein